MYRRAHMLCNQMDRTQCPFSCVTEKRFITLFPYFCHEQNGDNNTFHTGFSKELSSSTDSKYLVHNSHENNVGFL
jgi:hypothetical protein